MKLFLILIFMAAYYIEPGIGADTNLGTSMGAGNSWATAQKGFDAAVAGDTVYLVNSATETLTALIDIDINSGTQAGGLIKFIGTNSLGVDDGTKYVIDGNSAVANIFKVTGKSYISIKNLEIKNATSHGFTWFSAGSIAFENVWSHNNGGNGFNIGTQGGQRSWSKCRSYSNTSNGWSGTQSDSFYFCISYSNGAAAWSLSTVSHPLIACIAHTCTTGGFLAFAAGTGQNLLYGCVVNNCATGVQSYNNSNVFQGVVIGCRITNNATKGLQIVTGSIIIEDYNYINGNGTNVSVEGNGIRVAGGNSVVGSGTEGYTAVGSNDFNLTASASLRRTAVAIDSTNNHYITAGLAPTDSGSGGSMICYDD